MAIKEFRLPDIGEGVAEGEIGKWLVREGEEVKEFQPLAEIMTDKVNVEMPSPFTGRVVRLIAKEGDVVRVGQPIMQFEISGDEAQVPPQSAPSVPKQEAAGTAPPVSSGVRATPAVRKRARELGLDIEKIQAGADGRITLDMLEKAASGSAQQSVHQPVNEERMPVRGIRRKIFEKMTESKSKIPHFNYTDEVDMTGIVSLRSIMQKRFGEEVKLTFLPFIIKALISALKDFPKLNSSYDEKTEEIVIKHYYNIGIAVATEDGLVVPVIKNADARGMKDLATEVERLASSARNGKLALSDVQGGTFTITNVGPIGGLFSSPVINYPESAILAIHKIEKRPVVREGQIVIRDMMFFTIACDHRIIDGAEAAIFGNRFIEYLQHPALLRLE